MRFRWDSSCEALVREGGWEGAMTREGGSGEGERRREGEGGMEEGVVREGERE